ncbi:dephospho-CoA kinase, partial [Arthrospira platensis SPKY1]|nr:dephospho-CoA kinase [Arthrospira platensis SPKY1]
NDPDALRRLEQILHPAVQQRILARIQESPAEVVMIEAIKLLEGRLRTLCRQIWVTRCTRARQLQRLQICRGMDRETAEARIDAQNPQSAKVAQADIVIDTNGLMRDTQTQFELAWARLPAPAVVAFKPAVG